ncbi:hypothetical protein U6A24_15200 [Aquimarina gracilis]|uniref:Uncharacterized protein n=1 Tax=Aquimarina gracilis TaxID=874422 RepID=A0ABU5ZY61_9FLAO|nr:hypothetical protein [Aquimarina gracilis]MEB3346824.1 hypothetical protein [Aquimarina gracilis]
MSKENFDQKLSVLNTIAPNEVKMPNMPIDAMLQEAENLFVWASEDKMTLTNNSGLDWDTFGEDLPTRAGALRHAQSVWISERYSQEEANKTWKLESPKAYQLRDDLLDDFRYAFRKRPDLLARVRQIANGRGDANMIQDLSDLSILGESNPEELTVSKFKMEKLDTAAQLSSDMAELLAKANGATQENSLAKLVRDRAFTHLKEALDEVRAAGKYVFKNEPERFKGYVNQYLRRQNVSRV